MALPPVAGPFDGALPEPTEAADCADPADASGGVPASDGSPLTAGSTPARLVVDVPAEPAVPALPASDAPLLPESGACSAGFGMNLKATADNPTVTNSVTAANPSNLRPRRGSPAGTGAPGLALAAGRLMGCVPPLTAGATDALAPTGAREPDAGGADTASAGEPTMTGALTGAPLGTRAPDAGPTTSGTVEPSACDAAAPPSMPRVIVGAPGSSLFTATSISSAVWYRPLPSWVIARLTMAAISAGTWGATVESGAGGPAQMRLIRSCKLAASLYGGEPVSASYITAPKDQTSVR